MSARLTCGPFLHPAHAVQRIKDRIAAFGFVVVEVRSPSQEEAIAERLEPKELARVRFIVVKNEQLYA